MFCDYIDCSLILVPIQTIFTLKILAKNFGDTCCRTIIKVLFPHNAGYEKDRAKKHDFMLMVLKDPVNFHHQGIFLNALIS